MNLANRLQHPASLEIESELGRIYELLRTQAAGARGRDELGYVVEVNHPGPRRGEAERAFKDLPRGLGVADFIGKHQPPEFCEKVVVAAHVTKMQWIGIG